MFSVTPDDLSGPVDIDSATDYFLYDNPSASFSLMAEDIRMWRKRLSSPDWQMPPPPPTATEIAAIYHYTGSGPWRINPLLRGDFHRWVYSLDFRDKSMREQIIIAREDALLVSRLAIWALRQLPHYQGVVHRNVNLTPDQLAEYQVGRAIAQSAFTSTTRDYRQYARVVNTYFVVQSATGKSIQRFSHKANEDEVLFPPGTLFQIIQRRENFKHPATGENVTLIDMEQK